MVAGPGPAWKSSIKLLVFFIAVNVESRLILLDIGAVSIFLTASHLLTNIEGSRLAKKLSRCGLVPCCWHQNSEAKGSEAELELIRDESRSLDMLSHVHYR